MTNTVHTLALGSGHLDVTVEDQGHGRPFLLLHGGGGPQTVVPFAGLLADERPARVVTPVHPGFNGTARPDWLIDVPTLARAYGHLLDTLGLTDVTVVGNSIGGWIATEMALLGSDRISGVALVNAVGIRVPGHQLADVSSLTPAELSALAYHDPAKFAIDPSTLPEAARAAMAANSATLQVYSGPHGMEDPTLRERLAKVTHPALVVWGESDQVVDTDYGRAYAAALPDSRFELLHRSGHLPQLETPAELLDLIWEFTETQITRRPIR
ncbi:alpha/beta hydrolase [Streptomyces sp. IMTB 2501]|uniref:alpha/beta fold hydrolase n=1 Tax=Streptomyces sp. IMTB 2501 TaxID=1776340 RepID=UPI00096C87B0|nr:alpha/beta hydrolase [Streptomyces sp. IMTB 2501]OLZ74748.1 alpha/beta hydrolase [Streptomyces sp. IMTB 2501]